MTKLVTEAAFDPAALAGMMPAAMLAAQDLVMIELAARGARFSLAYLISMPKLAALVARDLGAKVERMPCVVAETTSSLSHGW